MIKNQSIGSNPNRATATQAKQAPGPDLKETLVITLARHPGLEDKIESYFI